VYSHVIVPIVALMINRIVAGEFRCASRLTCQWGTVQDCRRIRSPWESTLRGVRVASKNTAMM